MKLNSVEVTTLNKDDLYRKHHPKDWGFLSIRLEQT